MSLKKVLKLGKVRSTNFKEFNSNKAYLDYFSSICLLLSKPL